MSISSLKPIAIAASYTPPGRFHAPGVVSVYKAQDKFELNNNQGVKSAQGRKSRLAVVEDVSFAAHEQQRQQAKRRVNTHANLLNVVVNPIFSNEMRSASSKSMPGSQQLLGELINRMGGAGVYSGPSQFINIVV